MESVLLIGKPGERFNSLHEFLSGKLHVQYGSDNPEVLRASVNYSDPYVIAVYMEGFQEKQKKLFEAIDEVYPTVPVVTVGTFFEHEIFQSFEADDRYDILIRPASNEQVLEIINKAMAGRVELLKNRKKKVLVVDDDGTSLRSIKAILESQYEVFLVNSGVKALASIEKYQPDLIVLDYEMPGCDGKHTLSLIRAEEEFKDIPVIFLTGISDQWHVKAVLELKPAGYLLKPPNPQILLDKIQSVLA